MINRLLISIPLFAVGFFLTQINFAVIWRYFAWSNQTLATVILWTVTIYPVNYRKNYWIAIKQRFQFRKLWKKLKNI
jgi:carbon starvation protein CstA